MRYLIVAVVALVVAGCATRPNKIEGTYVSPSTYAGRSCKQLTAEREHLVAKVDEVTKHQRKKATDDAVAVGVGVVLFWPALFLLAAGQDKKEELASLKGNYDAVTAAGIEKGCFTD